MKSAASKMVSGESVAEMHSDLRAVGHLGKAQAGGEAGVELHAQKTTAPGRPPSPAAGAANGEKVAACRLLDGCQEVRKGHPEVTHLKVQAIFWTLLGSCWQIRK